MRLYFLGGLGVVAIFIWFSVFQLEAYSGKLLFEAFDVGQGDSLFVQCGGNQVLIDGGPSDAVLAKLSTVMPFWDRSIDLVILTHAHADHVTGLIGVLKQYKVGMILESGEEYATPEYRTWHEIIAQENIPVVIAERGQEIHLCSGATLSVLSPYKNYNHVVVKNPHDANVSMKLVYGDTSALLMGDAEKFIEYQLLSLNPSSLKSDILKAGHHGSKTSTSEDFLRAVLPNLAVISVGRKNSYGHPHQEVLNRLKTFGITIKRTDLSSDLRFVSDGKKIVQE